MSDESISPPISPRAPHGRNRARADAPRQLAGQDALPLQVR